MERLSKQEVQYLKELSKRVKEISQDPIWGEKEMLWEKLNSLQKTRPMVLCTIPEAGWDEIVSPNSLITQDPLFREFKHMLRKYIYKYSHFRDDEIISDTIYVPFVTETTDWIEGRVRPYDE